MSDEESQVNNHPVVHLSHGPYAAEIATYGGGIRSLTYRGLPLMEGYSDGEYPPLSVNVVLAPWPNRIRDGRFYFHGQSHQLSMTEPDRNNAIHGFVSDAVWDVMSHADDATATTLATTIEPQQGWPWALHVTSTYELSDQGLTCTCEITHPDSAPGVGAAPVAYGFHSYLSALGSPIDECTLDMFVRSQLPLDPDRKLPSGDITDITAEFPIHHIELRDQLLDDCFGREAVSSRDTMSESVSPDTARTDLSRRDVASDIRAARLLNSDGRGVQMWVSPQIKWFQVFTADPSWGYPYPGRGRALAVEPMTVPPDAFNSGTDVANIAAGESLVVKWRIGYAAEHTAGADHG
ncbi:aldose 1-epimerase family protein [Corynebacterium sp. SFY-K9]|uniref:aldose 1-epimerase family protein n=1 Tax=Corynebacterium sp. SFY-K9 TaxID=3092263 RepID=UPI00298EF6E2|nr:aldose 1-epimerase family protein [Corynebacterium sp. SFY-K9]